MIYVTVFVCVSLMTLGVSAKNDPTAPFPSLSPFVSTFLQSMVKSEILYKIFSSAVDEMRHQDTFYDLLYQGAIELNSPDPKAVAVSIVHGVDSVLDIITPSMKAKAIVTAVEHLLNDNRVLTATNAVEISKYYAALLENKGLSIGPNPAPGAYLRAIVSTSIDLFNSFHIMSPVTSLALGNYLNIEYLDLRI